MLTVLRRWIRVFEKREVTEVDEEVSDSCQESEEVLLLSRTASNEQYTSKHEDWIKTGYLRSVLLSFFTSMSHSASRERSFIED